ncbi:MAG: SDR family oxidoreductase [Gammaproteobacteria bacterium]|nr:SDR family oxidoreductase [Gammaproteobacteria bacterium]
MESKVAIITGASSGIGTAVAESFVGAGYRVMAAGRDRNRTADLLRLGSALRTWIGDVAAVSSCSELVTVCIAEFGRLDVLVNNAGIYRRANAEGTTDADWRDTLAVNLDAPFYLSRAALPELRRTRGVILNIASDWGLVGARDAVAYCASKGGLVLMSKAMALDHAAEGVRVNAICPGDVETPMLYEGAALRGISDAEALREAEAMSPTGRVTSAAEVAALALFLASDSGAQITGAAIPIDGGNTAG